MTHDIALIWDGNRAASGGGVYREGNTIVAGPGEKFRTDSGTAERLVRQGLAHYPSSSSKARTEKREAGNR